MDDVTPSEAITILLSTFEKKVEEPAPIITLEPVHVKRKYTTHAKTKYKGARLVDFKGIIGKPLKHYVLERKDTMTYPEIYNEVIAKIGAVRRVSQRMRRTIRVGVYGALKQAGAIHVTE
jgi:hypothetical protein